LYFNSGKPVFFDPIKILVLCNSESKKLINITEGVWTAEEHTLKKWKDESLTIEEIFKDIVNSKIGAGKYGISLGFGEPKKWEEIADWIIDLWHGKLYRITEKTGDPVIEKQKSVIPISFKAENKTIRRPFDENDLILFPPANTGMDLEKYRGKLISELKRRGIEIN
jgi:hypothetical protein